MTLNRILLITTGLLASVSSGVLAMNTEVSDGSSFVTSSLSSSTPSSASSSSISHSSFATWSGSSGSSSSYISRSVSSSLSSLSETSSSSSSSSSTKLRGKNDSSSSHDLSSTTERGANPAYYEMCMDALSERGQFHGLKITTLLDDILIYKILPYLQECPYIGTALVSAYSPWFLTYPVTFTLHADLDESVFPVLNFGVYKKCNINNGWEQHDIEWGQQKLRGNGSLKSWYGSPYQPKGEYSLSVPEYAVQTIDKTPIKGAHCQVEYSPDSSASFDVSVMGEETTVFEHDSSVFSTPKQELEYLSRSVRFWNKEKQPLVALSAAIDPKLGKCVLQASYKNASSSSSTSSTSSFSTSSSRSSSSSSTSSTSSFSTSSSRSSSSSSKDTMSVPISGSSTSSFSNASDGSSI